MVNWSNIIFLLTNKIFVEKFYYKINANYPNGMWPNYHECGRIAKQIVEEMYNEEK